MNKNNKIGIGAVVILVILFMIFVIIFLPDTPVYSRDGYKEVFNSYDNFVLKDDYKIIGHSSDYVCCIEAHYMVKYFVSFNGTTFDMIGFVYLADTDEVIWAGGCGDCNIPDYVISYH